MRIVQLVSTGGVYPVNWGIYNFPHGEINGRQYPMWGALKMFNKIDDISSRRLQEALFSQTAFRFGAPSEFLREREVIARNFSSNTRDLISTLGKTSNFTWFAIPAVSAAISTALYLSKSWKS